jgi:uncharacterized protein (DUF1800 family)
MAVFKHPDFTSPTSRTGLVKQPIEYLAGAARALGLDAALTAQPTSAVGAPTGTNATAVKAARTLPVLASALGQVPFDPPNVGGWGQNGYWLDTATAQIRLEVALLLARRADLSAVESASSLERPELVASMLGIDGWGSTTAAALDAVAGAPVQLVALALVAPEYVLA